MRRLPTHRLLGRLALGATLTLTAALGAVAAVGAAVAQPASASRAATSGPGTGGAERTGSAAHFPVTVSTPYGKVTVPKRPDRIISLSPTLTEMLFAIHAGSQVVAVDDDSDYPKNAPRTSLSGYTPNVEAIAGYRPDLVVISYNPTPPNLVTSLHLLGIPTLYVPAADDLSQVYSEITELGRVTGQERGAASEVSTMRSDVASLVAQVPHLSQRPSYFYEIGYDPLYTATSRTFIGSVLALAGLRNIAGASVAGSDYPEYSSEALLRANPTFIFVADGSSIRSVDSRPGWSALTAVRDHRVIELNEDVASRWGPRIVDLLRTVVAVDRQLAQSSTTT